MQRSRRSARSRGIGYGFCGGDATTFSNVTSKLNAVQSKAGRYTLDFSFGNLIPAVEYRLWGTRDRFSWFAIGTVATSESGSVKFSFQTTEPAGLGFDLNTVNEGNITGHDVVVVGPEACPERRRNSVRNGLSRRPIERVGGKRPQGRFRFSAVQRRACDSTPVAADRDAHPVVRLTGK